MTDFDRAARSSDVAIGLADNGWGSPALFGSYPPGGLKRHVESARRTDRAACISRRSWPGRGGLDCPQGNLGRSEFLGWQSQRPDHRRAASRGGGGVRYGFFRLVVVVGAALAIGAVLFLVIKRTRFGMIIRAGVDDRSMVSALGVNIQLVFAGAFFIGALLAGLAGVLGGTMIAVQPGNDSAFLLDSLIVVIIGGMGSLGGAAIGSIALGLVSAYADVYLKFGTTDLTNYAILLTFILVVAVLAVRPLGLFGRPA